jgi:pyrroline-5-carboxylate reductase
MKIAFIGGGNMATALIAGLAGKVAQAARHPRGRSEPGRAGAAGAQYGVTTAPGIDAAVAAATSSCWR